MIHCGYDNPTVTAKMRMTTKMLFSIPPPADDPHPAAAANDENACYVVYKFTKAKKLDFPGKMGDGHHVEEILWMGDGEEELSPKITPNKLDQLKDQRWAGQYMIIQEGS